MKYRVIPRSSVRCDELPPSFFRLDVDVVAELVSHSPDRLQVSRQGFGVRDSSTGCIQARQRLLSECSDFRETGLREGIHAGDGVAVGLGGSECVSAV